MTRSRHAPADERLALADSALRFLRERYADNEDRRFDAERWREFAALGWLAAPLREASGGLDLPWSTVSAVVETLAAAVPGEPLSSQWALIARVLDQALPSAARDAALSAWLAGDAPLALAHDEDAAMPWHDGPLRARFHAADDFYVIEGDKTLVLDAGLAQKVLVSAQDADGQAALFLVDAAQAGLRFTARDSIDGRRHPDLALNAVRVPAAARLDFAGREREVLQESAWLHALLLGAEMVGLLAAMLRASHEYLVQRMQFGRALIEFQVLQHRLVDMLLTLTRLESLLDIARRRCDELGPRGAAPFIAALKAACGEEGGWLSRQAVQLHGAIGLTAELALGRQLRRLTALSLAGGSSADHERYWRGARAAVEDA